MRQMKDEKLNLNISNCELNLAILLFEFAYVIEKVLLSWENDHGRLGKLVKFQHELDMMS